VQLQLMQQQLNFLQQQMQQAQIQPAGAVRPKPPEPFDNTKKTFTVEEFIYQMDLYFRLANTPVVAQVAFAGTRLQGAPLVWFRTLNPIDMAWDDFQLMLLQEFLPLNAVRDARDALSRIKQEGAVRGYLSHFRVLCIRVPNMTEEEKLDKFLRGLEPDLRRECEAVTVEQAARIAERTQAITQSVNRSNRSDRPRHAHASHTGPAPMDINAMAPAPAPAPSPSDLNRLRTLQTNVRGHYSDRRERAAAQSKAKHYHRPKAHTPPG